MYVEVKNNIARCSADKESAVRLFAIPNYVPSQPVFMFVTEDGDVLDTKHVVTAKSLFDGTPGSFVLDPRPAGWNVAVDGFMWNICPLEFICLSPLLPPESAYLFHFEVVGN